MRELVFGLMPEGATPETHIPAGVWCFSGREERFPGWDGKEYPEGRPLHPQGRAFALPSGPYADGEAIAEAARAANGEALRLTRLLGPRIFDDVDSEALSPRFLDMALGPYFLLAVHMLAERQQRALALVDHFADEPLRMKLLTPDQPFSFWDCEDFKRRGIHGAAFNHYVYSRIIEALAPQNWRFVYSQVPSQLYRAERPPRAGLKNRCRRFIRDRLRDLPFPRYKGFQPWQTLLLSLAVLGNKRKQADASIDFSAYCDPPLVWRFPVENLLLACLPRALRERPAAMRDLREPSSSSRPGPLRGMTAAYMEDDVYRLRLAAMRERGCRLFSVQHGANYGNLASLGSIPFEYSQHAFFTWGWREHRPFAANARPLPHPALCAIAGRHEEKTSSLILVGTEMSGYAYRLKSRPQARTLLAYQIGRAHV